MLPGRLRSRDHAANFQGIGHGSNDCHQIRTKSPSPKQGRSIELRKSIWALRCLAEAAGARTRHLPGKRKEFRFRKKIFSLLTFETLLSMNPFSETERPRMRYVPDSASRHVRQKVIDAQKTNARALRLTVEFLLSCEACRLQFGGNESGASEN